MAALVRPAEVPWQPATLILAFGGLAVAFAILLAGRKLPVTQRLLSAAVVLAVAGTAAYACQIQGRPGTTWWRADVTAIRPAESAFWRFQYYSTVSFDSQPLAVTLDEAPAAVWQLHGDVAESVPITDFADGSVPLKADPDGTVCALALQFIEGAETVNAGDVVLAADQQHAHLHLLPFGATQTMQVLVLVNTDQGWRVHDLGLIDPHRPINRTIALDAASGLYDDLRRLGTACHTSSRSVALAFAPRMPTPGTAGQRWLFVSAPLTFKHDRPRQRQGSVRAGWAHYGLWLPADETPERLAPTDDWGQAVCVFPLPELAADEKLTTLKLTFDYRWAAEHATADGIYIIDCSLQDGEWTEIGLLNFDHTKDAPLKRRTFDIKLRAYQTGNSTDKFALRIVRAQGGPKVNLDDASTHMTIEVGDVE